MKDWQSNHYKINMLIFAVHIKKGIQKEADVSLQDRP